MKMGKKPRKSTDLAEPVRMVPLGGYLEKIFRGAPRPEKIFSPRVLGGGGTL